MMIKAGSLVPKVRGLIKSLVGFYQASPVLPTTFVRIYAAVITKIMNRPAQPTKNYNELWAGNR